MKMTRYLLHAEKRKQASIERLKSMENIRLKKKANVFATLCISIMAIFISLAAFSITTYAWFTENVSNTGNKIQAGILDVDYAWTKGDEKVIYTASQDIDKKVFEGVTWYPGSSDEAKIIIKNNGNLAVDYSLYIEVSNDYITSTASEYKLENILDVYVNNEYKGKMKDLITAGEPNVEKALKIGSLDPKLNETSITSEPIVVKIAMPNDAAKEYENSSIKFDLKVYAKQKANN